MKHPVKFRFVQKEPSCDGSFDVAYVYVFFIEFIDRRTEKFCRLKYIARAEIIDETIAVKFYASRDRKSPHDKYSLAHGQLGVKAVMEVLDNCLKVIAEMIIKFPGHSFVFKGAEGYDPSTSRWEDEFENQRFRIYRSFIAKRIGDSLFEHFHIPDNSIYMLIRKDSEPIEAKQRRLITSLYSRYGLC
ncbi:MAG: hypothetical protein K2H76_09190 [Muribaculaceae bacterium]|nr:hypothetical protein [Muribaculaceae bacterium]MDE6028598.1 hypothetical protein [Muribaculaceae bacterium]